MNASRLTPPLLSALLVLHTAATVRAEEVSAPDDPFHLGLAVFGEGVARRAGLEAELTYALLPAIDVGLGAALGQYRGGFLLGSMEFTRAMVRPFLEVRGVGYLVPEGSVLGGGVGVGLRGPALGGRAKAIVAGAAYAAPRGYNQFAAFLMLGYEFGFGSALFGFNRTPRPVAAPTVARPAAPPEEPPAAETVAASVSTVPIDVRPASPAPGDGTLRGQVTDLNDHPLVAVLHLSSSAKTLGRDLPASPGFEARLGPGTYAVEVVANGYLARGGTLEIRAGETLVHDFQLRPVPATAEAELTAQSIHILHPIHFAFNESRILSDSFGLLDQVADILVRKQEIQVRIEGNTDDVGGTAYNQRLSENRARSVLDYLVERGVVRHRLTSIGYGKSRPLEPNTSDAARARNRRVEFIVR